ncbi:MAG: branched-chain amino acid ABC transporter permease, partial [Corynebacterium sp.]|nr:branched-chain amino acid ABC transporter permease [Corynebacterium sp.]
VGLDFALTALFVVLALEALDVSRDVWLPVVAVVAGAVGYVVSREQMLLVGLSLYFVYLVARFLWEQRGARDARDARGGRDV